MVWRLSKKRAVKMASGLLAVVLMSISAWIVPAANAQELAQPRIVQVSEPAWGYALDDQGNVWCKALHAISVKDGFYPEVMVKAKGLNNVVSIAGNLVLKEDGTVWTIESIDSTDINEHISAERGDPIPNLKNIVKIYVSGMLGAAIDKDGRLWIFETGPRWLKNSGYQLKSNPVLVEQIDHLKDMTITNDSALFLKEDGSVWAIDYYTPVSQIHSERTSLYDTIRSNTIVQMKELSDMIKLGDHAALKKDGTVWIWGRNHFAKPYDDGTENAAAPFQVSGLSDIVDFSFQGEHALLVKRDGSVLKWGYYIEKMDAIGSIIPMEWNDLTPIDGLTNVVSAASGTSTDAVIKSDGSLWLWGVDRFSSFHPTPLPVEFR